MAEDVRAKGSWARVREVLVGVPVEGVRVAVQGVVKAEAEVVVDEKVAEAPRRFPTLTRTGALVDCLSV